MNTRLLTLTFVLLFCASSAFAATGLVFYTGFETNQGFTVGNLFGQNGWEEKILPDTISRAYVTNAVAGGTVPEGEQCVWIPPGPGVNPRSAVDGPLDISSVDVSKEYVRVHIKIWPDAQYSEYQLFEYDGAFTNMICRMLRFNDLMWFSADSDDDGINDWTIDGGRGGPWNAAWYDTTILLDFQRKRIIEVTTSNRVFDCTTTNEHVNTTTGVVGFRKNDGRVASTLNAVFLQSGGEGGDTGRSEVYVDDIRITTETMPPGAPEMEVSPPFFEFPRTKSNGVINVFNAGTGSFTYTATILEPQSWLSIDKNAGTVTVQDTINLNIDRTGVTDGYYRSTIFMDAGDRGATTVQVMMATGLVLYYTDFEHDHLGELFEQDLWRSNPGNRADVTNDFNDNDGNFVFIHNAAGFDGYARWASLLPANMLVQIGAKFYVPDGATAETELDTRGWWQQQLDIRLVPDGAGMVNLVSDSLSTIPLSLPPVPVDEWFDLKVTMDMQSVQLMEIIFGEERQAFTNVYLDNPTENVFDGACVISPSESGSSGVCFDDFFINEVERVGTAILSAPRAKEIPFTSSTVPLTLGNEGAGEITYTIQKIDAFDWLTVSPTSGTFETTAAISCTGNRTGLGDSYNRCRLLIDGGEAGAITSTIMLATGTVFYETDFGTPWYRLGNVDLQDIWVNDDPNRSDAIVTNMNGSDGQCLLLNSSFLHDGINRAISMEAGGIVRLSGRFYMPGEGGASTLMFLTRDFWHEKLYNTITRDDDFGLVELSLPALPDIILPAVKTDTWFTFSYTMDLDLQELTQVQFGDVITNLTLTPLQNIGEQFFNSIAIFCETNGVDAAGILADDILLEVVPEPTALILGLLLLGAAVLRRKN